MITSGYGMGKVWQNGHLQEDIEVITQKNNKGLQLVVRDKDNIEYMRVPNEKLFEIVLQQAKQVPSLDKRISALLENKERSSRKTVKRNKKKKSKKTKSSQKKHSSRKGKSSSSKTLKRKKC